MHGQLPANGSLPTAVHCCVRAAGAAASMLSRSAARGMSLGARESSVPPVVAGGDSRELPWLRSGADAMQHMRSSGPVALAHRSAKLGNDSNFTGATLPCCATVPSFATVPC
eukprot:jgi/Ulvmu1/9242/UM005_0342.1